MHIQSRISVLEHEVHRLTDIGRRVTNELAQVISPSKEWITGHRDTDYCIYVCVRSR